jgi:XTP/dITP diphosphohydrolase
MKILLATTNQGKVAELIQQLSANGFEVLTLADMPNVPDVVEDQETLQGNAQKKAKEIYQHFKIPTFSDDTGLEVAALDGKPGVYSARYAGSTGDAVANRKKLLTEMQGKTNREAQFRTVVCFFDGTNTSFFEGICKGIITNAERGEKGFGYDALFQPEGFSETFAELDIEIKNQISHRGKAVAQFLTFAQKYIG